MMEKYVPKRGIDVGFKPYDIQNSIYDARFQTSSLNPNIKERNFNEDIERELERFKIVADRVRDSPIYVKSFDKRKVRYTFETNSGSRSLDSIDEVRKNAINLTAEKEVPKDKDQIRWIDE